MRKNQLTLAQKIFRIRRECPTIERKGVAYSFNPEDKPAYAYAQVEDVLTPINALLDKYKLLLTGEAAKEPMTHVSKTQSTTEVMMVWTLEDIDTAEARTYRIPGSGSDNQGKGVFKSMTGSRKYACILIFNLILGDEPEENSRAASSKEESTRNVDAGVSGPT